MFRVLHLVASPRDSESRTLKISYAFIRKLREKYRNFILDEINLFSEKIPEITTLSVTGKYRLLSGKSLDPILVEPWKEIIMCIERFLAADLYLISSPMWNFNVPYPLKKYIDIIMQPGYTFRYSENGPEGLLNNKKMIVITTRGGDYGPGSGAEAMDLQMPYLRTVFGLAGITDITFVNAQPMDAMGPEVRKRKLEQAVLYAEGLVDTL